MAEQYNPQGQSQWLFVTTIANPATPTVAELAAGVILGDALLTPKSPMRKANSIESTPVTASSTHTLPALAGTDNAELTMQRGDKSTADTYDLFNTMKAKEGDTGWLVHAPRGTADGLVAGGVVDVWPAYVNTVSIANTAPGQAGTWTIAFTHDGDFHENVLIAA